jgi:hypothetical protein
MSGGSLRLATHRPFAQVWTLAGTWGLLSGTAATLRGLACAVWTWPTPPRCSPSATSLSIVTLSCHVLASPFPMKHGGGPQSGGWRLRLAPDCLRGVGGRLRGGTSAARGALKDSRANLTFGDLAGGSAVVAQGKLMPVGSTLRQVQASRHIKFPLPSISTRAGMVVRSKKLNSPAPRCPAAVSCGMAVQFGILSKYWFVSSAEAHLEMKTTVASLHQPSSAMRDCRNGPQCGHDSRPKNKPTTAFP